MQGHADNLLRALQKKTKDKSEPFTSLSLDATASGPTPLTATTYQAAAGGRGGSRTG